MFTKEVTIVLRGETRGDVEEMAFILQETLGTWNEEGPKSEVVKQTETQEAK